MVRPKSTPLHGRSASSVSRKRWKALGCAVPQVVTLPFRFARRVVFGIEYSNWWIRFEMLPT